MNLPEHNASKLDLPAIRAEFESGNPDAARHVPALLDALGRINQLCRSYTPEPPPIFRGPGLSEHGKGFNHGTRTLAEAVLGQLNDALNPDGGADDR